MAAATKDETVETFYCDNHPDVVAVAVSDGKTHNVQHYCAPCTPPQYQV